MISLTTKDGSIWEPQDVLWRGWCNLYGAHFVTQEAAKAELWLLSNPDRAKTERGMARFFNGWLARATKPVYEPGIAISDAIPYEEIARLRQTHGNYIGRPN